MNLGVCQSELPWGDSFGCTASDVTRICEEAAALGASSIRVSALWQQIEPSRNYKYKVGPGTDLDRAIVAAEDNGLDILLIVEPRRVSWLQFFGVPMGISATAKNARDYGLMCRAIAEEYGDRISYWEVGNEVNNLAFFGAPKDPAKYLEFLRHAHDNIKAVDASATVLAGALMAVGTGWPSLHPVEWVTEFYKSTPSDYFDGLSMHPYSTDGVFGPMAPTPDNEYAFRNVDSVRAIMDANGDGPSGRDIKIFCSEWGYDSIRTLNNLSTTDAELEAEQAANLQTHWNILESYADAGIIHDTTWVYNYRDQKTEDDPAYRFGAVRLNYTKKAAWYFLRSLAAETEFEATTGSVSVQGQPAELQIFTDPNNPVATAGTISVAGHAPTVVRPISVPAGSISVQGWPPTVTALREVQYVSTGAGDRDITESDDILLSWAHTIASVPNGMLLAGLVTSTHNSKPWELYDTLTVTSSIDGAFTRLASRHIAASSNKKGSVHIFGLANPTAGAHTIEAHVEENDLVTHFNAVAANTVLYSGVSATGAVFSNGSSSGGNTPNLATTSTVDNMVFAVFGGSDDFSASFNKTIRHDAGSNIVDGNGDYILIADAAGAPSVTFTASIGLTLYGAVAVDLLRV